jgi:hypothetical protein
MGAGEGFTPTVVINVSTRRSIAAPYLPKDLAVGDELN